MLGNKPIGLTAALVMFFTLMLPAASLATPALAVTTSTSVAPVAGSSQGGTDVTIAGTGFIPGTCTAAQATGFTTVTFDIAGTPAVATNVVVVANVAITATTGAHAPGGPVTVTVAQGASVCGGAATTATTVPTYTYVVPAATSISPASGPTTGGTPITITGVNLNNTNSVTIDGVPATGVSVNSVGTSVTATTGFHPLAGTFVVCVDSTAEPGPATCGPAVFTYTAVLPTATPTPLPGTTTVSGTVAGSVGGGDTVVLFNTGTGASFATTTSATGTYSLSNMPPGTYRVTVAPSAPDVTGCASSVACGFLIFSQVLTVGTSPLVVPPITLISKITPTVGAAPTGVFGYAVNAATGAPIVGATVTATQGGAQVGVATTDANGRFEILGLPPGGSTVVTLTPSGTVGLNCTIGGINTCTDTVTLVAGWNDPAFLAVVGTGPVPPSPPGGFSLALNGTSAFAEAPHATELNLTGDWTIEAWFKDENPSFDHPRRGILSKGDAAGPEVPYFLGIGSRGLFAGLRTKGTPQVVSFDLDSNQVGVASWHHVAATMRASTHELSLYLDGVPVAHAAAPTTSEGNTQPMSIGRSGPLSGHYWRGTIDDVRVWRVARTEDEIQANFRFELLGAPAGLVGNWKFNEGIGASAADSAGSAENAALRGGAEFSPNTPGLSQPPTPPGINISDASCSEGTHCVFTVTRSGGSDAARVSYRTTSGTATEGTTCAGQGVDFIGAAGTVFIAPDSTAAIAVAACVDLATEASETFNIRLIRASEGTIFRGSGVGAIAESPCLARDAFGNCIAFGPPPGTICLQFDAFGNCIAFGTQPPSSSVAVADATCPEPLTGAASCTFTVTAPTSGPVAISGTYTTTNSTALGGSVCATGIDYVTTTGTWTIPAFSTTTTVQPTVQICGGDGAEAAEVFLVTISVTSGNATVTRSTATGTIPANTT